MDVEILVERENNVQGHTELADTNNNNNNNSARSEENLHHRRSNKVRRTPGYLNDYIHQVNQSLCMKIISKLLITSLMYCLITICLINT